jgi:hypothetical protein
MVKLLFIFWISGAAAFAVPPPQSEIVCGMFSMEDYGERTLHTVTAYNHRDRMKSYYTIRNTGVPEVQRLLSGSCYCLSGESVSDPEYWGDAAYRLLEVARVITGPYYSCMPAGR